MLRWAGLLMRGRHAGEQTLACRRPALAALPAKIELRSPGYANGEAMARSAAGEGVGENRSPALMWEGVPPEATHWLLLVEDPDVPLARPIVHALCWGPAAMRRLPEGCLTPATCPDGVTLGVNGLGNARYDGPRPLPGHGPHRYVFQLFALTAAPPVADNDRLLRWLDGNARATGCLIGVFQRDWRARVINPPAVARKSGKSAL
ncbi:YbhB/YbcL family Raf kinase inhibitor-like protein [Cupriavidus sp. IDO]|uniref:YbhB/YbcL family Raf kinase inhibitor-like protein n=1 Tax=Cupriavidus sp. IDO TaxID=1539142 RepID=UPI00187CB81A|nr:YbhB/YbcL family Raf kinase inhibitor-like protein [Cupriavidus sp. IDO]